MVARLRRQDLALPALVGSAFVAYALLAVARHVTYRSTGFDLAIFDQALWHLSNLEAPASSLKGLPWLFGDHFSPIIVLLVPFEWLGGAIGLLIAQTALVCAAAFPLHAYARRRAGSAALAIVAGYLGFVGVQRALLFDVHEVAFAPLLVTLAVLWGERGRHGAAAAAGLSLLLVKEDLAFLVVALGVWHALAGRHRLALLLAGAGIAWYAAVTTWVIPAFAGGAGFAYWSYTQFGSGPVDAVGHIVTHPWRLVTVAVDPIQKLRTMVVLFGAFAGLSLLSPLVVLALPLLAERMLSTNEQYWTLQGHYSLVLGAVLALAAADALGRLGAGRLRRAATVVIAALAALSFAAISGRALIDPDTYTTPPAYRAADEALERIAAGASVAATNRLVPHLAHRDDVRLLEPGAVSTEYVVAALEDPSPEGTFPNPGPGAVRRLVARLARTSRVVFRRDGIVVLERARDLRGRVRLRPGDDLPRPADRAAVVELEHRYLR